MLLKKLAILLMAGGHVRSDVELGRYQEALTDHSEDKLAMVDHSGDSNNMVEPVTTPTSYHSSSGFLSRQAPLTSNTGA
jgi:hypothetical protein